MTAEGLNAVARSHREIESRLHGCLDVVMTGDQDRLDNDPSNVANLTLHNNERHECGRIEGFAAWNVQTDGAG
jgi:hypothetical protein